MTIIKRNPRYSIVRDLCDCLPIFSSNMTSNAYGGDFKTIIDILIVIHFIYVYDFSDRFIQFSFPFPVTEQCFQNQQNSSEC